MNRNTLAVFLLACDFAGLILASETVDVVSYEHDVRPILKANCFRCHGEGSQLEGKLDLRMRRLIAKGGDSGTAITPGQPDESLLFERVRAGEMPPETVEKRLTSSEIETIRRWIARGAKTLREEPPDADPNSYLTEEELNFWAFRPITRPRTPKVQSEARVRTPVDAFLLERLEQKRLSFSAEADRRTLLRRLYCDLLGLPPNPDEVDEFLTDSSPDAYERLVDRLLASPHYGERWGRHWLDAAGYADSEGYDDDDSIRPDAWKYRDYVLRALNADKPFDRFVQEQVAGDELIGRELTNLTTDEIELLTATGYLRMAPDGTGSNGVDQNVARNEVIAKTMEVMSTSLLGLSVGCAQCHNHRYDPISQEDYYALRAVFEPALDWKNWRAPTARRISLYTDADRQRAAEIEEQAKKIEADRNQKQEEFIQKTLEKELAKLPAELHAALREARSTPKQQRNPEQQKLIQRYPSVDVSAGSLYLYDQKAADELKQMADEAARIRQQKPREEFVRALWEPVNQAPPQTFFFSRGLFDQPQQPIAPRPLRVLSEAQPVEFPADDPSLPSSGRRLALAKWLTCDRQPLTARVIVNRVWLHHFGRGLVETPGDFGFLGARPTHPELLDWLASEFTASGWSIKRLHRLLLTSTVFRQSSLRHAATEAVDPENRLYSRMAVRRIEAEVLRDSMLAVSGQLNAKFFGPPVPVMTDPVGQFVLGIENLNAGRPGEVVSLRGEEFRRSVYVQARRSRPLGVLDPFDLPRMEPNCTKRSSSTVAIQSLLLMNHEFVTESATALASRLHELAGRDVLGQVRWAWRIVYADEPTESDLAAAAQFILDQATHFAAQPPDPPTNSTNKPQSRAIKANRSREPAAGSPQNLDSGTVAQLDALTSFCHALLSSNRFLYVD